MDNKIRSIIITPVTPRTLIRDVGYLQVDTKNKKLIIYDDQGNVSEAGVETMDSKLEEIDKKYTTLNEKVKQLENKLI